MTGKALYKIVAVITFVIICSLCATIIIYNNHITRDTVDEINRSVSNTEEMLFSDYDNTTVNASVVDSAITMFQEDYMIEVVDSYTYKGDLYTKGAPYGLMPNTGQGAAIFDYNSAVIPFSFISNKYKTEWLSSTGQSFWKPGDTYIQTEVYNTDSAEWITTNMGGDSDIEVFEITDKQYHSLLAYNSENKIVGIVFIEKTLYEYMEEL